MVKYIIYIQLFIIKLLGEVTEKYIWASTDSSDITKLNTWIDGITTGRVVLVGVSGDVNLPRDP